MSLRSSLWCRGGGSGEIGGVAGARVHAPGLVILGILVAVGSSLATELPADPPATPTWTPAPTLALDNKDCRFRTMMSDGWTRILRQHGARCVSKCPGGRGCPDSDYVDGVCDVVFAATGVNVHIPQDDVPPHGRIETIRVPGHSGSSTSTDVRHALTVRHTAGDKTTRRCSDPLKQWRWAWGHICSQELQAGKEYCNECDTSRWSNYPLASGSDQRGWGIFSCYLRDYIVPSINDILNRLKEFESPNPGHPDGIHVSPACAGAFVNAFADGISQRFLTGHLLWRPCSKCDWLERYPGISACESLFFAAGMRKHCKGHPGRSPAVIPANDDSELPFWLVREICQKEMIRAKPVADGWRIAHGEAPYPTFTPTPVP